MSSLILVVDNDPATVHLIQDRVAAATALRVISAPGALQGLEMAVERSPGLVVLNAELADGLLVCDHLRQQPKFARVPIVLLTDPARGRTDPSTIAGRADLALVKPLAADAFDGVLARAFGPDWRTRKEAPSVPDPRTRRRPVRSFVTAGPSRTDLPRVTQEQAEAALAAKRGSPTSPAPLDEATSVDVTSLDEPTSVDAGIELDLGQATLVDGVILDEPTITDGPGPMVGAAPEMVVEWAQGLDDVRAPATESAAAEELARLSLALDRYKTATAEAARHLAHAEEERDRAREELTKARREADELGAALAAARSELAAVGGEQATDGADAAALLGEVERLRGVLAAAERARQEAEEKGWAELAQARRESEQLGAALADAREALREAGKGNAEVAALQAEVGQLRDALALSERERQAAETAIIDVIDRFELAKARHADLVVGINHERDKSRVEAAQLRKQLATLQTEVAARPAAGPGPGRDERVAALEQQLREKDYALAAAHAERDQAVETLAARSGRELEQVNKKLAEAREELEALRARVDEAGTAAPGGAAGAAAVAPPDAAHLSTLLAHVEVHQAQLEEDLDSWDTTQMKLAELLEGLRKAAKRYPGLQRGSYAVDTIVDGVADALAQGREALRRSIKTLEEQQGAVSTALADDAGDAEA